jgi:hypothetical protein
MNVMPEIVDSELQILQRKLRRVSAELWRKWRFGGTSESEDGDAWHGWRRRWLQVPPSLSKRRAGANTCK